MPDLNIAAEDPAHPDAAALMEELNAALAAITGERRQPSFDPEFVRIPMARFVVARDAAGQPLGCGAFRPYLDGIAEVRRVYARPGTRGVGSAIMDYLEAEALRLGYRALWLETRQVNTHAIAFYQRRGFRRIPNYGRYEAIAAAACFEKRLAAGPGGAGG